MLQELLQIQQKNPKRIIGLMSGTSADGIDACLAEISGNGLDTKIKIVAFETYPGDKATRTAILEACNPEIGSVDKICRLNFYLGRLLPMRQDVLQTRRIFPCRI
ncbi:MAG: anhydro-N-acetylmuramic acid kinase [Candidatus Brocadiaceae bacterium]